MDCLAVAIYLYLHQPSWEQFNFSQQIPNMVFYNILCLILIFPNKLLFMFLFSFFKYCIIVCAKLENLKCRIWDKDIKLSEIFIIGPKYGSNPIVNIFIGVWTNAQHLAVEAQTVLVVLHIKNKLGVQTSELFNSRNPSA